MRSMFSRLFGFAAFNSESRKVVREKLLLCERLESRDVPASVLMRPGSDAQTQFSPITNGFTLGGDFLVTRDVQGQIIDFNHDGNADAINFGFELVDGLGGQTYSVASEIITPLLSNGSGLFYYTSVSTTLRNEVYLPSVNFGAVVDYDGDGFQDIIGVRNAGTNKSSYYHNKGDGTFEIDSALSQNFGSFSGKYNGTPLTMADFNGDGALDVLIPGYKSANNYTLLNGTLSSGKWTGQFDLGSAQLIDVGTFNPNPDTTGSLFYNSPLAVDLGGDGFLDIVTQGPTGLRVFPNDGAGVFSTHIDIDSADKQFGLNLVAGDFNKDGKTDIASTPGRISRNTSTGIGKLSVYINNTATAGGTPTFAPAAGYLGIDPLGTMAVADFNLDGNLDIAVAVVNSPNYRILSGIGAGAFGTEAPMFLGFLKLGAESGGIGVADWNNDGQIDVAMGARFPNYSLLVADVRFNQAIGVSLNATFPTPALNLSSIPNATVGVPYSLQLAVTGGDPAKPFSFALSPASIPLPAGLSLSPTGLISGTPTRSGPFQLFVTISQPNGPRGTSLLPLQVNSAQPGVLAINPSTLPNVSVNQVVSQQLSSVGGAGPIQYAVSSGILPAGLSLSGTGLISGVVSATGTFNFTVSVTDGNGSTGFRQYTVVSTAAPLVPVMQAPCIVAGASAGNQVTIFNADGTPRARFRPFSPAFKGGVNVAQGDITGDGVADLVVSVAHGAGPIVSVFDGRSLALVKSFTAYVPNFTGGVHVAAGDVDGDGRAEVVTGAGPGEFSRVKVFNGTTGTQTLVFFAFAQGYKGGVTVAAGDVNGDGRAEIIAGSLTNSRSIVRVFNGSTGGLLSSILPYAASFTGGVTVAAGDINGDGKADIVVGTAAGIAGTVKVYNGADNSLLKTLTPYAPGYTGGVSVSAADLNGDQKADIVTGTMQANIRPVVKAFSGANYAQIDSFFAYSGMVGVSVAAR